VRKSLLIALLVPWCLAAQIKLFLVEEGIEREAGESHFVGTVTAGESIETTFRARNISSSTVLLHGLNVAGYRFSFASLPKLPLDLPVGQAVEFVVRFQPENAGSYSAYLNINGARHSILHGIATASVVLALGQGTSKTVLETGRTVDFGSIELGSKTVRRFSLSNPTDQPMPLPTLTVDGVSFRGPSGIEAPLTLKPEEEVFFEVAFEPRATGAAQGTLHLGPRQFLLSGTGLEAVFSKPQIVFAPQTLSGGQQVKVSVRLESPSQSSGGGELSMEFTASVPGKGNDPAVLFPATGKRSVEFTVSKGQDQALFGSKTETEFQTGTTAGAIVFTARLGLHSTQATVVIPPAPVAVDSVRVVRAAESLDVQVTGFDTSRSASGLSFTFYDRDGREVAPGAIHADATAAFRQYFEATDFGSIFTLHAVFPVTGNGLQIIAVEVELTNSQGATRYPRVAIQ